jgi:hypothetical protein
MTKPEQFSDEEWQQVGALPGLVIMAASLSDGKIVPSVRELAAGAEALAEAGKAHPESVVVQSMLAADIKPEADEVKKAGVTNVAEVVEVLVGEITEAIAVLRSRVGTDEVAAVGAVLLAMARAVVERLGTGFMGSGQDKVSPTEQSFVDRLTALLAAP